MPEAQSTDAAATESSESQETPNAGTQTTDTPPTETVEFWKSKAREQEKRAKENAAAAVKLAEFEDAQKTESQRLTEAAEAARNDAAQARAEALRLRIAAKHGISDEDADTFLTGADEDTLTRQAERLSSLAQSTDNANRPGPRPDLSQGARDGSATAGDPAQQFAQFLGAQLR